MQPLHKGRSPDLIEHKRLKPRRYIHSTLRDLKKHSRHGSRSALQHEVSKHREYYHDSRRQPVGGSARTGRNGSGAELVQFNATRVVCETL